MRNPLDIIPNKARVGLGILTLTVGSIAFAGCGGFDGGSDSFLAPNQACKAINGDGETVYPDTYPTGNVTIDYINSDDIPAQDKAEIQRTSDGGYVIVDSNNTLKPSYFDEVVDGTQDFQGNNGQNVVASFNTAATGVIGLTTGCIVECKTTNNLPADFVKLPTPNHP